MIKHRGTVLLTALLIIAITSSLVMMIFSLIETNITRSEMVFNHDRGIYRAQLVLVWAKEELVTSLKKHRSHHEREPAPIHFPTYNFARGKIDGKIIDEQAYYNINNLTDQTQYLNFINLLNTLFPNHNNKKLALSIMKKVSQARLKSVSELRQLPTVSAAIYQKLQHHLVALPNSTAININTADAITLTALSPQIDANIAHDIIDYRENHQEFTSPEALSLLPALHEIRINPNLTTIYSDFFMVHADVTIDRQHVIVNQLLKRTLSKGKIKVVTIK